MIIDHPFYRVQRSIACFNGKGKSAADKAVPFAIPFLILFDA
jgi:hypothetical protein